jgi:hypothetical protein
MIDLINEILMISPFDDYLLGVGWSMLAVSSYGKCTDLVLWGNYLTSNVGYPRFNKLVSNMIELSSYTEGVVVGVILSDGWLTFATSHAVNARLGFQQSLAHFHYFWFVFTLLSPYCSSYPHFKTGVKAGVRFYGVGMFTRSLPCFTELFKLFYDCNGRKILPPVNILYELLTPVALAHWIIGDGQASHSGLILCTHSYTVQEVVQLINVLILRYRLDCTLQSHHGKPVIYIRERSMSCLRTIVIPHMQKSMFYKIKA